MVIYDACVLFPAALRDLLIRIGHGGLVRARWTDTILDECFGAIRRGRPEVPVEALRRTRRLMCEGVRDCMVTGFEGLVDGLELPDPKDRHVLAAAIRAGAEIIVTRNLKDFPAARLAPFDVQAQDPDEFVLGLLATHAWAVPRIIVEQAADLKNPPRTAEELLSTLEANGLTRSVAELSALLAGA